MKSAWILLAATCALVVMLYACVAHSGYFVSSSLDSAGEYYNLLVKGFQAGQLNLKTEVPPGLARLADPYDPRAHAGYPVLDMSYYKGKLYLYFGVTPAVVLFWPYAVLTGHYLPQKDAAVIFCIVGFFGSVGLLYGLWRRYFDNIGVGVVVVLALALGTCTSALFLLAQCNVHEVAISCAYAFMMLALAAIWKALHHSSQRTLWLATASLAYGLAVGARPDLLFGAIILLVPVAHASGERQRVWGLLIAAMGPMVIVGCGLMLYNWLRFDNPAEFGFHYQLAGDKQFTHQFFSFRYLWFNFRVYFLQPGRWGSAFPFVRGFTTPPAPSGYGRVDTPIGGILINIPLVWLALAAPLTWHSRSTDVRSSLRRFLTVIIVLFGICALTLCLLSTASMRYEVDFLPALVLLAVVGILGLERVLADHPRRQVGTRCCWGLLLVASVVFNLLVSIERYAEADFNAGLTLEAVGQPRAAMKQYEQALRLNPNYAEAHNNLGVALMKEGKLDEAIGHIEQAVRLKPDFAQGHNDLGDVLLLQGKIREAAQQYEEALTIKPDYAEAHYDLAVTLAQTGKIPDAMKHYERALEINPDLAQAHNNLGKILVAQGKLDDGIAHYQQALRINPDYAQAHDNFGFALAQTGRIFEAMEQWEQALRINPRDFQAHCNLGNALERQGRVTEAIKQYEQALAIRPDFTAASNALARLRAIPTGR